jgi:signal transduction histidine kinase
MRFMRISALTTILFGLMLAAVFGSGALTLWHSRQSRHWDTRIALAQVSYAEHLALQSNIYQLFKQHGDALLFGDRDGGALESDLRSRIDANLAAIRSATGREIELVGEEEIPELDHLARIESKVATLTAALGDLSRTGDLDAELRQRGTLIELLDSEIDGKLALLIGDALQEERAEVDATLAAAEAFRRRVEATVSALMAAAIILGVAAGLIHRRLIVSPILSLAARVEAFRAGRQRSAGPSGGASEIRQLGRVLDDMMVALDRRELSNQEQTEQLEQAVQARTAELSRVLTQVEQSEASRRQMMADVSHELRTPLTIIQGEADVSLRGQAKSPDVYRESLSRIRETARLANHVVDDLMLIARQESGKLRLDLREVDLCAILRDTVALLPRAAIVGPQPAQALATADPVRIRQCLLALLQNAVRYGGSSIWTRVEPVEAGYALIVEDDGPGMSDAEKAQAFDRFFRGSNAARPEIVGTGLGLPIVRAIALAHGGSVTLDDREGGGLRVVMVLAARRPIGLVWDSTARGQA